MSNRSHLKRSRKGMRGHRLTERDFAVLDALRVHRYMRADHFHALLSPLRSIRTVQWRLKRLWECRYLDRRHLPFVAEGGQPLPRRALRPVYALTRHAAELLRDRHKSDAVLPHGFRTKGGGLPSLDHHLVVTDFMVALRIACERHPELHLLKAEHEHVLWPKPGAVSSVAKLRGIAVPDAAFTLLSAGGKRLTFYLEVVRAGVGGGNRRGLRIKLDRYAWLRFRRFFEYAYGHKNLRAVLYATTSPARAEGFRAHAEALLHGRNLFWFGSYRSNDLADDETVFTPENILTLPWRAAGDATFTLAGAMKPDRL